MMGKEELIYFLIVMVMILIVSFKVKVNVYKYFILFILLVSLIPILLLIGSIRQVEYRKEFIEKMNSTAKYHIMTGNCQFNNENLIREELKKTRPFIGHRSGPINAMKLKLLNGNEKIDLIIASDTDTKEQFWIFYRKNLIGSFESKEVYDTIYAGNCSKTLEKTELPY